MKNAAFIFVLVFSIPVCFAQPNINNLSVSPVGSVTTYDKFEIRFKLKEYRNNYNPEVIRVDAKFISPSGKTTMVPGFYFQDFEKLDDVPCGKDIPCEVLKIAEKQPFNWIIRHRPDEEGKWLFQVIVTDKRGKTTWPEHAEAEFTCESSDNEGYFSLANKRYLKKGEDQVFLVGPNICWYGRTNFCKPGKNFGELGTNDFIRYIDSLAKYDVNFIRVWIDNPPGMALVGREWTTGKMHGFGNYNQKDAWQLDQVFEYADKKGINIILTLMNQNTFVNFYCIDNWKRNNAFNRAIKENGNKGIRTPFEIFYNRDAITNTKHLFRYIIARWGNNTNLIAWELWNEVDQISNLWGEDKLNIPPQKYYDHVAKWHSDMADFFHNTDPYNHLITTSSPSKSSRGGKEFPIVWYPMDFTISHDYKGFDKITDKHDFPEHLLRKANSFFNEPGLENKPYMCQEWGINTKKGIENVDPHGYGYHSSLWASSMTGAFGSISANQWDKLIHDLRMYTEYPAISKFMNDQVPELRGDNKGARIEMNGLTVFYMSDNPSSLIVGWCQDDAFEYSRIKNTRYIQNLKSDKPKPNSSSGTFSLPVNKNKTEYIINWYNTKDAEKVLQQRVRSKRKKLKVKMPDKLRNSTFGDGAFIVQKSDKVIQTKSMKSKGGIAKSQNK